MCSDSVEPRVESNILNEDPENIPPKFFDGLYVIVGINLDQFFFLLPILDKVVNNIGGHLLVPVEIHAFLRETSHLRYQALIDLVGNTLNLDFAIILGIDHDFGYPRVKVVKLLHKYGNATLLKLAPNLPLLFPSLCFPPWISSNPFSNHGNFWLF